MPQTEKICTASKEYLSIIHLDRLELTLRYLSDSTFKNFRTPDFLQEVQSYGQISLVLDNSKGIGAYHNTYMVHYNGVRVGKLHTANKMKKPEVEFDFDKAVLYSVNRKWWYEIFSSLKSELGLEYNNIKYAEIALDTTKNLCEAYRSLYDNTVDNKSFHHDYYKLHRSAKVDVLDNGTTFNIRGKCNMISIYEKTRYAEDYILDFFKLNGFSDSHVYRVEVRLNWNYLKSKMSYKKVRINLETLMDIGMLTTLFKMSVENKLTFSDLRTVHYDKSRNLVPDKVSILDDICLDTVGLVKFIPIPNYTHYMSDNVDENILRQLYYRYLESGKQEYFNAFMTSSKAACLKNDQILALFYKFNNRYKGNRTASTHERMEYAIIRYSKRPTFLISKLMSGIQYKLKKMLSLKIV